MTEVIGSDRLKIEIMFRYEGYVHVADYEQGLGDWGMGLSAINNLVLGIKLGYVVRMRAEFA